MKSVSRTLRLPSILVAGGIAAGAPANELQPSRDPAIFSPEKIPALLRSAADYQFALDDAANQPDPNWQRAVFYTGVMATYYVTGDARYLDRAIRYSTDEGDWKVTAAPGTGPGKGRRHADRQTIGQTYLEIHFLKNDPAMIADVARAFDEMIALPYPGRDDWWWCDSLYMAPPTLTRLYIATKEQKYLTLLDTLFADMTEFLYDPAEHLYYRDKNYFDAKSKNGKKVFWSRGNGWVVGGLCRTLEYLPENHPTRARYEGMLKDMLAKIAQIQGPDGMWRTSLLDADDVPGPEASGTGFFTYATAWAINHGLVSRAEYESVVRKGWAGLNACLSPEGRLGYVQRVGKDPQPTTADETHTYGVGAFLNAGREVLLMHGGKLAVVPPAALR